jgi:LEA14-like dessication related protein
MSMAFTSCALLTKNLKDPEIKFMDLSVSSFSVDTVELDLKLNVKNPNDVDLEVNKITYGLALSGKPAAEGVFAKGAKVVAYGQSDLIIPLKFKYSTLGDILKSLVSNDLTKEYELKGAVDLGFISIPFTKKGEIKLK